MSLEKAEFSGDDGIIEIDVEAGSRGEALDVLETVTKAVEDEYGFERYR